MSHPERPRRAMATTRVRTLRKSMRTPSMKVRRRGASDAAQEHEIGVRCSFLALLLTLFAVNAFQFALYCFIRVFAWNFASFFLLPSFVKAFFVWQVVTMVVVASLCRESPLKSPPVGGIFIYTGLWLPL